MIAVFLLTLHGTAEAGGGINAVLAHNVRVRMVLRRRARTG
jgi:hypothetical protein